VRNIICLVSIGAFSAWSVNTPKMRLWSGVVGTPPEPSWAAYIARMQVL